MAISVAAAPARGEVRAGASSLALWHLLSLDAPCVAVLWTLFTARCFGVSLPAAAPVALGAAVWVLYAADRMADARHSQNALPVEALQERHRFHHEHRRAFLAGVGCACLLLLFALPRLPEDLREAWMLLALPMALYAYAVHALRLPRLPKGHFVAMFFAVTTSIPVLVARGFGPHGIASAAVAFGAVCWLNCAAIARWEHCAEAGTAWAARRFGGCAGVLALLCLAMPVVRGGHVLFGVACSLAVLLLLWLDGLRRYVSPLGMRTLADAALLTPVLLWPLLPR